MILCNGERYFNIVLDSSRSEFVVRLIREKLSAPKKLYFSCPPKGTDVITYDGAMYEYNSLTLGGQFYSTTEGKYLFNAAFDSLIARPNTNNDGPFVLRDPTSGDYAANSNAYITTGTEAGRDYVIIKPGYTNVTKSEVARGYRESYGEVSVGLEGYPPYLFMPEASLLRSSSYRMDLYISAWFLCQVQGVFSIPMTGGIYMDVSGVFPNSSVPSGQVLHTCSLSTSYKALLGNLNEGFLLIYVSGGNTVKLLPDDMTSAQGSTYWTRLHSMSVPALKVFLNKGGNVRICQWGHELACGPMNTV